MTKVFSGIRPSGKLHLGNYLGAIKNWIELQDADPSTGLRTSQAIFAVVDYHGITTPYDPKTYQKQIMDVVLDYLAAGVDPDKALLIRQSKVPQHTELAWLFDTVTPVGWLDRLPTYKEKQEQIEESSISQAKSWKNNMGILNYPVLMAADILIYKSNLVPAGDEQLKHIDVTNEIAKKFSYLFGETFEPVKPYLAQGSHILSLQDPAKKMSKTGDEGIALSDNPDTIRAKIKKAVTDSGKDVKYDERSKPAISNLLTIYHLLSPHQADPLTAIKKGGGLGAGQAGKSIQEIETMYQGKSYVDFKNDLAEVVVSFLKPFQEKRKEFENNPNKVLKILTESEEKARVLASSTLQEVKKRMGLE